jgi:predicted Fe-S protein YdhL (DUF1289 family)
MIDINLLTKDDLASILTQLSSIQEELQLLRQITTFPKVVRIRDIARMENVSTTHLYGKGRFLLPRFGVPAYSDGATRWDLDEYLAWRKIPHHQRVEMWWNLPAKERQNIVMRKTHVAKSRIKEEKKAKVLVEHKKRPLSGPTTN